MNAEELVNLVNIPEGTAKEVTRALQYLPEEAVPNVLALILAGQRTPSGESWTVEKLNEVIRWQTETSLPVEITEAITVLNEFLAEGRHEVNVNNNTVIVLPKKPLFMVPKRTTTRRGRNGEVVITLVINNEEIPVSSFSELVRALGSSPRHEHGLKQAAPLARAKGATILISGRPSETVVRFAQANSDVVELL